MKKIIPAIVMTILVFFACQSAVYSRDYIEETPNLKVIINGELQKYTDVPLSVSQRTMLPLRELLTQLGVQNDDEHIIWNNTEKSITIFKDDIKIYLKVGDTTAYVNDLPITLDTPPFGYIKNQRVYIPARFVAQALGKIVVWDGTTKTVLIRDEDAFNRMKGILEKTASAMERINKAKIKSEMNMNILRQDINVNFVTDMVTLVDKKSNKMRQDIEMPLFGRVLKFKSYYTENTCYNSNDLTGKWEKKTFSAEEFNKLLDENMLPMTVKSGEILCAGLTEGDSGNLNEILLRGNIFPKELFGRMNENAGVNKLEVSNCYLEVVINRNTGLIKRLYVDIRGRYVDDNRDYPLESQITSTYSDYDGDFEVEVPEGFVVETR
jgi:hypothetical protein